MSRLPSRLASSAANRARPAAGVSSSLVTCRSPFLSSAAAHYVAGVIAGFAAVDTAPGGDVDPLTSLPVYTSTFELLAWVGVAVGVLVMLSAPLARKRMHERVGDA